MLQITLTAGQQRHERSACICHWRMTQGLHLFQGETGVIRSGKTGFSGALIGYRPEEGPARAKFAHRNMNTRKK